VNGNAPAAAATGAAPADRSYAASDVAPLTRWTKLMMMLQSAVSVAAIALVIARAVNILG
jgi:hypothetical protein